MSKILEKLEVFSEKYHLMKHEGSGSLLLCSSMWAGGFCGSAFRKYYKNPILFLSYYFTKHDFIGIFDIDTYRKVAEEELEKYLKTKTNTKCQKAFGNSSKKIGLLYKKTTLDYLNHLSNSELKQLVVKSVKLAEEVAASTIFAESFDEEMAKKWFVKLGGNEYDFKTFFYYATLLTFDSMKARRDKYILQKVSKINLYDFQWMDTNYFSASTLIEVQKKITSLNLKGIKTEIIKNDRIVKININKQNKFKEKMSLPLKKLLNYTNLCMLLRDLRKDYFSMIQTVLFNAAYVYFSRLGLKGSDCVYSHYLDYVKGVVGLDEYPQTIEKRKKGVLELMETGNFKEYNRVEEYGDFRNKIFVIIDKKQEKTLEVHGQTAYAGKVKGRVVVVIGIQDFDKLKDGDILITSMTRPEFVPIMKKALAIVTDEGGITCHAAIIAREMKKPCIIGTKNATRVLKDGDIVEVDAEKGIVKIINPLKF